MDFHSLYPDPHPKQRARSFPVPTGMMPMGGGVHCEMGCVEPLFSSRLSSCTQEMIHPIVPSPPTITIRRFGTLANVRSAGIGSFRGNVTTWSGCSSRENCE